MLAHVRAQPSRTTHSRPANQADMSQQPSQLTAALKPTAEVRAHEPRSYEAPRFVGKGRGEGLRGEERGSFLLPTCGLGLQTPSCALRENVLGSLVPNTCAGQVSACMARKASLSLGSLAVTASLPGAPQVSQKILTEIENSSE